ncbi:4-hydroxyphenylacetate 3-hydroxylase [bacterium SCGC AG-212-C10]|nr:4-hydroxyphenylacetate 3-hydroxylase [bacterium SCGC AG-212-C10]
MALKNPTWYRESLNDGRVTYIAGESVPDITKSPWFDVAIDNAADDYVYDDPATKDIRLYETEDGNLAHRIFKVPSSVEDLQKRIELSGITGIATGVTAVLMALYNIKDQVAKVNGQYAENIVNMYKYCRDNDLRADQCITDAKGDRSRHPKDQDDPDLYMRIVDKNADGIIVRGAKLHITGASLVHEQTVMPTKAMGPGEEQWSVSFSVPTNTKGVKIINRAYAHPNLSEMDYPISGKHNAPEGFVVFEDVFVPWDRVFLAGETPLAGVLAHSLGLWERVGGLIGMVKRSQLLVGTAQLLCEMNGIHKASHIQEKISDLVFYNEMLKMSLAQAVSNYKVTETGMVYPDPMAVNVGKFYGASNWHGMVQKLHDMSGALVLTLPLEADYRNEELTKTLDKYLHTRNDVVVEDRMRVYNLIRDLTADSFGGWELVTTLAAGGGLAAQRIVTMREYDLEGAKTKAKEAAGIIPGYKGH